MALSIKFPIGARVAHRYSGPATVIGGPFKGGDGVTHLPVKFDNPEHDGSSGYHESNFTLIEIPTTSFSDWALNPRTVALMKRCDSFEKKAQVMRGAGLTLQRELDVRNEQLLKLEQRIVELESALRMMTKLKDVIKLNRIRLNEKVTELENAVKVQSEFIELQSRRLINARKHITRIRVHCDLPEPGDSGEGLDP